MTRYVLKRNNYSLVSGLLGPGNIASMGVDSAVNSLVKDPLNRATEDAMYEPTVENAFVTEKKYSVGQAVTQVSKGVGKGLLNYSKKNKKAIVGSAKFGAGMTAGIYGLNKYAKASGDIHSGDREYKGPSDKTKAIIGVGSVAAGAETVRSSMSNAANRRKELPGIISKEMELKDKALKGVANAKSSGEKYLNSNIVKGASNRASTASNELKNLNKVSKLGVKSSTLKSGVKGLAVTGALLGTAALANKKLKSTQKKVDEQKNYSFAAVGRVGKYALSQGKYAKAAGTYIGGGTKQLIKSAGDFMSPGKNSGNQIFGSITKSLKEQGEYGKKAADRMNKMSSTGKTLTKSGLALGTGALVYDQSFKAGDKAAKGVIRTVDKDSYNYMKKQESGGV